MNRFKKYLRFTTSLVLSLTMLLTTPILSQLAFASTGSSGNESSGQAPMLNTTYSINGNTIDFDKYGVTPQSIDNIIYLPIRPVIEAVQGNVTWDANSNTATLVYNNITLNIITSSMAPTINGSDVTLTQKPQLIGGRILISQNDIQNIFSINITSSDNTVVLGDTPLNEMYATKVVLYFNYDIPGIDWGGLKGPIVIDYTNEASVPPGHLDGDGLTTLINEILKSNGTANKHIGPVDRGGGSFALYRFEDKENYILDEKDFVISEIVCDQSLEHNFNNDLYPLVDTHASDGYILSGVLSLLNDLKDAMNSYSQFPKIARIDHQAKYSPDGNIYEEILFTSTSLH